MVLGDGKNLKSDNYLRIFIPVHMSPPCNLHRGAQKGAGRKAEN